MTTRHGILRSLKENVKLIQLFDCMRGGGGVGGVFGGDGLRVWEIMERTGEE